MHTLNVLSGRFAGNVWITQSLLASVILDERFDNTLSTTAKFERTCLLPKILPWGDQFNYRNVDQSGRDDIAVGCTTIIFEMLHRVHERQNENQAASVRRTYSGSALIMRRKFAAAASGLRLPCSQPLRVSRLN